MGTDITNSTPQSNKAFFSLVIPTRARVEQLRQCLQSLTRLSDQPSTEVIVVDDGSPEPIAPVVNEFRKKLNMTSIRQSNAGPAAARNRGAQASTGDTLVFLDDDCQPSPVWLSVLATAFEKDRSRIIGGRTVNAFKSNPFSEATHLLVSYMRGSSKKNNSNTFLPSCNMAVPGQMFRDLGGFDPRFIQAAGEDRDFCERSIETGHELLYASDAVVFHYHALTTKGFFSKHAAYGRGAVLYRRLLQARGGKTSLCHQAGTPVCCSTLSSNIETSKACCCAPYWSWHRPRRPWVLCTK